MRPSAATPTISETIDESNQEDKLVVAGYPAHMYWHRSYVIGQGYYYPSSTTPLAQIKSFLIIRTNFFILLVISALFSSCIHSPSGNSSMSPVLG